MDAGRIDQVFACFNIGARTPICVSRSFVFSSLLVASDLVSLADNQICSTGVKRSGKKTDYMQTNILGRLSDLS